jgi:thioredoxin 1
MSVTRRFALALACQAAFSAVVYAAADVYPPPEKAAADLAAARQRAKASGRMLMVIFGGNWCPDCHVLHDRLEESPVREYVEKNFVVVGINIGDMNVNLQIAKDLGVDLKQGVPSAGFFGPDGKPIAVTHGELAPSRRYDAKQVLEFVRKVAEQHVIERPK